MKTILNLRRVFLLTMVAITGILSIACDNEELDDTSFATDDVLSVSVTSPDEILSERFAENKLTINWTTGSNKKTGSSISYLLEIDKAGNDFSSAMQYEMGKNQFLFSMNHKTLNEILLNSFNAAPNASMELEARVTAIFGDASLENQMATTTFMVTPYLPVSRNLFIIGSATPAGWDISSAIALIPSETKTGAFFYEGLLSPGSFKFAVNTEGCWCQDFYTQDPSNSSALVHNIGGSGDDIQWEITTGGNYKIEVNLVELTIKIEESEEPPFSEIWMVGDASPSGWNVDTPQGFTRSSNPFIFTYEAVFVPGDFKIFAGPAGDWCGQWYRPLVNGQDLGSNEVAQNSGCETDNKWSITTATQGRYRITLDTFNTTVKIEKVNLYMVGDGGPNGWNIATPTPFDLIDGVYTFTGELGESNETGEFKISKFKGDWCDGEWINAAIPSQSILNTNYIITQGCDGPDNKWQLKTGEAGTYKILINLEQGTMEIMKQ